MRTMHAIYRIGKNMVLVSHEWWSLEPWTDMFRSEQMRSLGFFCWAGAGKMHSNSKEQNKWNKNCDDATAYLNWIYVLDKSLLIAQWWPRELPTVRWIGAKVSPLPFSLLLHFSLGNKQLRTITVCAPPLRISAHRTAFN